MRRFPELPIYTGFNTPDRIEADIYDLEVLEGEVPRELRGIYYHVRPDPQYPPLLGEDIYFNGDGIVSMFRFKDGHVDFRCRYVRTEKFVAERQARRALFGLYRNPYFDDESVRGLRRGTANTHVVYHAGRLYALKEDSPPVLLDPLTLKTYGYYDFEGQLTSKTFTAHPKIDPQTGEMIAFGYSATGYGTPDIAYYVISPEGRIVHEAWLRAPYASMVHDFAVTRDYVIFPIVPIMYDMERAKRGLSTFAWDSTREVYLGVLPRYGTGKDVRWFKGPNQFASHVMNAFNEGTRVYIDTPVAPGNLFPFFPDIHGGGFDRTKATPRLTRWVVDAESSRDGFESIEMSKFVGEFPRVDERYLMEPYRHGYLLVQDTDLPAHPALRSASGFQFNCLGHVDLQTGRHERWFVGPTSSLQEPTFVPRPGSTVEGDGYLLAIANRYDERRSDLLIFDALAVAEGPLAVVRLPIKLRPGLHGSWVPAERIPGFEEDRSWD
ncbi:MAG: carotenoid oxygenase family protein [Armatimonadota bacterium]|nr:carotenoid oxygenase family protein [Armatimonadota bacterium]MDR7443194.1 carotenoid oxygenase family protein [Armatimonadota bacterium]MDR7571101.1 carotenoid oxygenase family protein [Armatimonadota bacterium]MDR7614590.1 carotenoid oxygenase family protein [Armatimonadota bacterium]